MSKGSNKRPNSGDREEGKQLDLSSNYKRHVMMTERSEIRGGAVSIRTAKLNYNVLSTALRGDVYQDLLEIGHE